MAVGVPSEARDPAPLAERLRALLGRRASGAEAAQLAVFVRQLFLRSEGYGEALGPEEAAAMVSAAFRFYAAPGPAVRVRALTPTYTGEGWDAPGSIVETCMPDRPFVVDTIRERLAARDLTPRAFLHPLLACRRDQAGGLAFLSPPEGTEARESFTHVALPGVLDAATLAALATEVRAGLEDVLLVTDDFEPMLARARTIAAELEALARPAGGPRGAEAAAVAEFLRWLAAGAFVFLGYREYRLTLQGGDPALVMSAGTGLGILRREERSALREARRLEELPAWVRARLTGARLFTVAKTVAEAPVHRRAPMDDVGVRLLDAEGRVVGERRFLGLFTSKAYAEEAAEMPLLRAMLHDIVAAEQAVPGSHDHRAIVAVFNALPKWELLASTPADIRAEIRTILAAARQRDVVLTLRPEQHGQRVAALVVLPSARFSGEAHARIRDLLGRRLGGALLDDHLMLGDSETALLHFAFAAPAAARPDQAALREEIAAIVRTWEERLGDELVERHGARTGGQFGARFAGAFPGEYRATVPVERAAEDAALLELVTRDGAARVVLRNDPERDTTTVQLYLAGPPLVLSEAMPFVENLGLRALAEDQVAVTPAGAPRLSLQAFHVQDRTGRRLDVEHAGVRLAEAILALHAGRAENDALNRLVLEAGLDWRAVHALRAYAGFAVQGGLAARPVVTAALAEHPEPARLLFACFEARFRPGGGEAPREAFAASLDAVATLRDDLVLRGLLATVEATVRTDFFARPATADHVALKLRSADLAYLPAPKPLYEIYVHGPAVEGVHLRAGRIARGGLRASDRPEDFRTEVLGLMKTQTVKNAPIVPTGAKGGFVPKRGTAVAEAYETFVGALLALTDDLAGGRAVHPPGLVVHDEEDPYLVVAADKGTAAFSDRANALAAARGFWLGDAFASGGSHGYDHKALGITARGVWECVRTHFRELGLDADTAPLSVVGIGDMSGDVFGNGLLRSPHLRLRAAFDHRHVFLDPDPDPARTFVERRRLFEARLGWDAYDPTLLSPGGAVVPRGAKRVTLSPEAQAMLGLPATVDGDRLVQAVLTLDADLLWNGGIGTYVAATGEPDAEVRDAVNDAVRVRAAALRARVVAEGGNLGFTQRARIEYALAGGRIDTDAVDNSAGVDMSDHEVNLKICLHGVVEAGQLAPEERHALLAELTEDVAARVLAHNRAQSRVLGLDQIRSRTRLEDFRALMTELERSVGLDRALEALPDRDALRARRPRFLGLTRPELAVLMAYAKLHVKQELLASPVLDDAIVLPYLVGYFPATVAERWPEAVGTHPLRRAIIATELAGALVDQLGATFVLRMTRDTGAGVAEAVRAWTIAWAVVGGEELRAQIAAGNHPLDVETACDLALERTSERVTKWVLANAAAGRPAATVAVELGAAVERIRARLPEWIGGAEAEAFHRTRSELEMAGLPGALARELATAEWLTGALDVVTVAAEAGVDPETAAARYYGLGLHLDFAWLWSRLGEAGDEDRWQRRAVEGLLEDLLRARRALARTALARGEAAPPTRPLAEVEALLRDLRAAPRVGLAALAVVVREIRRLAEGWN